MSTSDPRRLRVALVQRGAGLDAATNRTVVAQLATHPEVEQADLVVLPEAFGRDFGSPKEPLGAFAEPLGGPFDQAVRELASSGRPSGAERTVIGGMFEASDDPGRPFNTLLVRGATSAEYRKIHLYDSFGYRESDRLLAGEWSPVTVALGDFTLGLMTCYDLRFPELARALVDAGADVLVVPAAWVAGRDEEEQLLKVRHWETLAQARAIENTCYVVAVGQPAPRYTGHSMVVDPWGEVLTRAGDGDAVLGAVLDAEVIAAARAANPALDNRRHRPG